MSKWEMVKIEEVCEILDSKRVPVTASNRESGVYPYYGANGVQDYVSEYIFDDELVLLAEDGGNFGSKTKPIAYRVSGKCWVNNHAHVLKARPMIDVNYLCYSIMFYDVSKIINGTTRAKLNQAAMRNMTIPLPPLETQMNIAKTLHTATELLAMRKQQLAELDNLIKSTFFDMFGDPVTNEKGWKLVKLGDAGELGSGGTPTRTNPKYFLGDIDWYSAGELNQRYLNESKEKLTIEAISKSAAKVFKKESMLIGMYDTAAFKLGILTKDSSSNQACANINVNKDMVDIEWLFDCALIMRSFFLTNRRGVRQKNLNLGMIKGFEIPLPPLDLQSQFASIVTKIEEQKAIVKKAIDETQYLFDSLISEYFE